MNRRDALKGVGLAFSGAVLMRVREDRPLEEHEFEPKPDWVRVVIGFDDDPKRATSHVYDRSGNELPWRVQAFDLHYRLTENPAMRIQMHFWEADEHNSILVSPEGFVVDRVFEGHVRA